MKEKTKITHGKKGVKITIENSKGELTYLKLTKEVTISGSGGAVTLPKNLIGKMVEVIYKKENDNTRTRTKHNR